MLPSFHYTLSGGAEDWREQIALARAAGFTAIDFDLREAATLDPAEALDALGDLRPATGRLPVYPGQQLHPAIPRFCRRVGIPVLTCSVRPSLPAPADLVPEYRAWAAQLADDGLSLAIEFLTPLHLRRLHPYPYIQTLPQFLDFLGALGPNCGVLFDTWHWHHGGYGAADIPAGLRVLHVHLADAPALPPEQIRDDERLFPGEGIIDLPAILNRLDYDGPVACEVFGQRDRFPSPLDRARYGLAATQRLLAACDPEKDVRPLPHD